MASFHDLTIGQQGEFQRVLASKGFTKSDAMRIIKDPNLATLMYAVIQGNSMLVEEITLDCCGESMLVDSRHLDVPWRPKGWFRGYECQRKTAEQTWILAKVPREPRIFVPSTMNEHPLLHVPDTFISLWHKVVAPISHGVSYTKYRWEGVKPDRQNLRLSPSKRDYTKPVWLAIDPERGKSERPNSFWGQVDCAASEVFSALIQFPEWPLSWFNGASVPNLSGYQLRYNGNWSHVPYLDRHGSDLQLELRGCWADHIEDPWSSPSVREC